jgi:glycosyltransferase involved in cell wall biosynthesis
MPTDLQKNIQQLFRETKADKGNLVSVILPLYNESQSIPYVLDEMYAVLGASLSQYRFEITFVDDCSTDNSFELIGSYAKKAPENVKVSVVRLAKNSGSHIAITAGLNICRGDFCVIMASDGQDPAAIIGTLLDEWQKGHDLVLASRTGNLDHDKIGNLLSRIAWYIMNWATNIKMPANGCDLLGLDKKVVRAFNNMDERNTTFIFRIVSLGFDQSEIRYLKRSRVAGKSKWTFLKKISILFDAVAGFSSRPLKLITSLGMFIFLLLVFRWIFVIVSIYIFDQPPTELTIILNTIFTVSAVQVLLLGFIGDYIWRILDETRKRPPYEVTKVGGEIFEER